MPIFYQIVNLIFYPVYQLNLGYIARRRDLNVSLELLTILLLRTSKSCRRSSLLIPTSYSELYDSSPFFLGSCYFRMTHVVFFKSGYVQLRQFALCSVLCLCFVWLSSLFVLFLQRQMLFLVAGARSERRARRGGPSLAGPGRREAPQRICFEDMERMKSV